MTKRIESDDDVVRDRGALRVPMMLMDAAGRHADQRALYAGLGAALGHRPGAVILTDADREAREASQRAYEERVASAWREPAGDGQPAAPAAPAGRPAGQQSDLDASRAAYHQRLENAWRTP